MSTILITGANRSLGFEAASRLIEAGHDVWIGARDEARGRAAAEELGARFVQLDVTDDASVAAAVETVGALDVLVNNAGIPGEFVPLPEVTVEHLRPSSRSTSTAPCASCRRSGRCSSSPRTRSWSTCRSGMGSIGVTSDPDRIESTLHNLTYGPSKTALNMLTTQWAKAYPNFRINAVDPGYTATDFNHHSGPQTVEEGTDAIVEYAQIGPDGPTGGYFDRHGELPW